MNCAVWQSIIHGCRMIIYFNHTFGGPQTNDPDNFGNAYFQKVQPGQTISIYAQAKATNALIKQLAPVINSPTAAGFTTVTPAPTVNGGIDAVAKYSNGVFYIFAATRESGTAKNMFATFTVKTGTSVTVINEGRTIPITGGSFTDTFATGNTVHIYRVNG